MTLEPGEKVSVFALRCQQAGKLKCLSTPSARQYAKDHGGILPRKTKALIVGYPGDRHDIQRQVGPGHDWPFTLAIASWAFA